MARWAIRACRTVLQKKALMIRTADKRPGKLQGLNSGVWLRSGLFLGHFHYKCHVCVRKGWLGQHVYMSRPNSNFSWHVSVFKKPWPCRPCSFWVAEPCTRSFPADKLSWPYVHKMKRCQILNRRKATMSGLLPLPQLLKSGPIHGWMWRRPLAVVNCQSLSTQM